MSWDPARHEAVRARCEAAPAGPWHLEDNDPDTLPRVIRLNYRPGPDNTAGVVIGEYIGEDYTSLAEAEFVAHARTDLPDALDLIEQMHNFQMLFPDEIREIIADEYSENIEPEGDEPTYEASDRALRAALQAALARLED